ncbi:hypothetical protein JIR23_05620 [Bradyrhizobium diazoefficiens]|nr:hypothetical protein [Bradyrhizobium diazoefficiens]QQN65276.1 hypothetical protein JIR23_05620 [Bradyrhizobium diazoefficiens]
MALVRDILDFRWAWPFLYPMANPAEPGARGADLDGDARTPRVLLVLGGAIILLDGWMPYVLKLWDFSHWSAYCS